MTRSNEPSGHALWPPPKVRPSPLTTSIESNWRVVRSTRRARCGCTSLAVTRAPTPAARPARSAALPPGPAHRSSHRSSEPPSSGADAAMMAASCEPSSWAPERPSRIDGRRAGSPDSRSTAYGETAPKATRVSRMSSASSASSSTLISDGRATRVTVGTSLSASRTSRSSSSG